MTPAPPRTDRDPRIDLLRERVNFSIFINYIGSSPARSPTQGGPGLSDVADLFMRLARLSRAHRGFQARNGRPALATPSCLARTAAGDGALS